jgi:hypothetical protein
MKKLLSIIIFLVLFTQGFAGCSNPDEDRNSDEGKDSIETTFKIINQSNYELLQVNYGGVEFGNVSSSSEAKENVPEGTYYIFFHLQSIEGSVYCRISQIFTSEYGKSNELIISNNTVIENQENKSIASLMIIYDEINTLPASLELWQSNTLIRRFGEYDFGSVIKGKTADVTFTIRNPGTVPLGLTGDPVVDSSNSIFTVTSQPMNTVDAESSVHFILSYTPLENKMETSTITILNDGDVPVFLFTVKGIGRDYIVGDTGPAGGIIFYDAGALVNGFRYLEAAPTATEVTAEWGAYEINIAGTQTAVGRGKQNTVLIVAALNQAGETGKAAQICNAMAYNGFNDWFLPSSDELDYIYKNLKEKGLGGFGNGEYWSSSQANNSLYSEYYAWFQYFNTSSFGFRDYTYKYETKSVRAVRAF